MIIANYHLAERICTTAGSDLHRARRAIDAAPVLLKVLSPEPADASQLECFRREYRLLLSLHAAEIVQPLALLEQGGHAAMVLADFDGLSLETVLAGERRLDWPACLIIAGQLAHALGAMHASQTIHRDIRPA